MRTTTAVLMVALGVGLATTTPAYAGPVVSPPQGRMCGFNSTTDPTREPGWQTGDINAGPLVTTEAGTLVCSIHVNNDTHGGAAVVTASTTATADAVAVMAPRPIDYQATVVDDVWMCTAWVPVNGPALYWVSPDLSRPTTPGYWDTSASAACQMYSFTPYDPECSVWLAIDERAGTNIAEVWQDCDGYEPII